MKYEDRVGSDLVEGKERKRRGCSARFLREKPVDRIVRSERDNNS